ncbi:uncharacterized protein MYCFIDRAFT_206810, partial [Pseudocercospora fijiensis CIRAD86]
MELHQADTHRLRRHYWREKHVTFVLCHSFRRLCRRNHNVRLTSSFNSCSRSWMY